MRNNYGHSNCLFTSSVRADTARYNKISYETEDNDDDYFPK